MRRVLGLGLLGLTVVSASSCLLVEPPSGHMSPPVEADDFCTRYAQTACDAFVRCCDDPSLNTPGWDRNACVQAIQNSCTDGDYSVSRVVHDERAGYDAERAGAVIGRVLDYVAVCDPSIVDWIGRRDGFFSPLQGTVANGLPCLDGENPLTEFPAFFSCEDFSQSCILSDFTHGNCNARHTAGGGCVTDFDCVDPLYCMAGVGSTCQPRLANGASCRSLDGQDHGSWCESRFCSAGSCAAPTRTLVYCGGLRI